MKQLKNTLYIATMILLCSLTQAQPGRLFNITESGNAASAGVILCLNGKGPLSCQSYAISKQNLSIKTTINHSYPSVGIKIVTPGYQVTGCAPYSNSYCLFEANETTAANITIKGATPSTYTVGGQVFGLLGTLVLENNNGDVLTINADGGFTFPTTLPTSSIYAVTVQSQPATQTCTVNNGTGIITNANVTNIVVNCSTNTHTIGGSVLGLATNESLTLQNNGGDDLIITANGGFTFSESVAQGATYHVSVLSQPTTQTCTVTQGSGTVGTSNITDVQVTCAITTYTVGGTVSGLVGTMILQNNGGDDLNVSTSPFTFSTPLALSAQYDVTVLTSPAGQVCSVTANGSGVIAGANVTNVAVDCVSDTILTSSISSLALSVTGRTEYGITPPTSGIPRIITINNSGIDDAIGFQVDYSGLPLGTSHTGTCDSYITLAQGDSCTIEINPGSTATSNNSSGSCTNGTSPVPGVVKVSATNASEVSTSIVVLDYGCVYQGGYIFAFDDTTSTANSVGGKVVSTVDQASVSPNGVVWSSNGRATGTGMQKVSKDALQGISENSTTSVSNPSYTTSSANFALTYTNVNPFTPTSFRSCNGRSDGSCNTENILVFYNQFITNYVDGAAFPFTASNGPTPLTYYAAGLCKQTIATYSDWYLPTVCEMGFFTTGSNSGCGSSTTPALQNIQLSLRNIAALTTPNGLYWSSTLFSSAAPSSAWRQLFASGSNSSQGLLNKNVQTGVRCVRRFTN